MATPPNPRRPEIDPTLKAQPTPTPAAAGASSRTGATLIIPPEVADAPASARFGKFVRTQKLGAGGMGEVWKAWDGELGRWVALKFLKGGDEEEFARFDREAQLAAKLTHPNIAAIYEIGQAQGRRYIAMQFVEGATLKQFRSDDPKLIVRLMRDAAGAVGYANDLGIVHRDLKPENIMVAVRGRGRSDSSTKVGDAHAYVMDFGLARAVEGGSEISISGSVVGTPAYMPPEQARGDRVDAGADVYALGSTLYALMTGRVPFRGKNVYDTLRMVQEQEATPPRAIVPRIDADLETIILKCLEKERSRRYADAHELAADLTRYLDGDVISARKASLGYRLRRKAAKSKAAIVVAGIGLAVVGLAVAILVPIIFRERQGKTDTEEALRLWSRIANLMTEAELNARAGRAEASRRKLDEGIAICRDFLKVQELAEAHYFLGRLLHDRGRTDEAEAELTTALKLNPSLGEASVQRGMIRFRKYQNRLDSTLRVDRAGDERLSLTKTLVERMEGVDPVLAALRREWYEDLKRDTGQSSYFRETDLIHVRALVHWFEGDADRAQMSMDRILELDPLHIPTRVLLAKLIEHPEDVVRATTSILNVHRGCTEALWLRTGARLELWKAEQDPQKQSLLEESIRRDIDEVMALLEDRSEGLHYRADCLIRLGDSEPALRDLTEAASLKPRDPEILLSLGHLHFLRGELDSAWEVFRRAAASDPENLFVRNNLALIRARRGECEAAQAEYDALLTHYPNLNVARVNRAALRFAIGDARGALKDLDAVLDQHPRHPGALASRGGVRMFLGDAAGAEADLAAALKKDRRSALAWHNLGLLRQAQERMTEAGEAFDEALRLDPFDGHAWFSRGTYRQDRGDLPGALADYEKAIRFSPADARPWFNRGIIRDDEGRLEEAFVDFTEAARRDPKHFKARYYRGGVRAKQGRLDEALRDFDEAHAIDPKNTELLLNRGILKRKLDRFDEAIRDFNLALEISPDLPEAYSSRADIWDLRGDDERALKDYRKALEVAPKDWPHRARIENNIRVIESGE